MKKPLLFLLVLALVMSMLSSCADDSKKNQNTDTGTGESGENENDNGSNDKDENGEGSVTDDKNIRAKNATVVFRSDISDETKQMYISALDRLGIGCTYITDDEYTGEDPFYILVGETSVIEDYNEYQYGKLDGDFSMFARGDNMLLIFGDVESSVNWLIENKIKDGELVFAKTFEHIYYDKYFLALYDDFNGDALDLNTWAYDDETERQDYGGWWDDSMSYLDGNGNLVIAADYVDGKLLSGSVTSKGHAYTKGYYEIRCKLPLVTGLWSAFWLRAGNVGGVDGTSIDGVEIDIMESIYNYKKSGDTYINHALHWDGYGQYHQYAGSKTHYDLNAENSVFDGEYHVFGLEWNDEWYIMYIDGVEVWRSKGAGICNSSAQIVMSIEFGSWAGELDYDNYPAALIVDYVKVYQQKTW